MLGKTIGDFQNTISDVIFSYLQHYMKQFLRKVKAKVKESEIGLSLLSVSASVISQMQSWLNWKVLNWTENSVNLSSVSALNVKKI